MPAALYPRRADMEFRTRTHSGRNRTHMKQYLLCAVCEQRFDQNGESEVLQRIAAKKRSSFPLQERMRLALPIEEHPTISIFAGDRLGFDMDKFAYFALSLVWRGAVARWNMPGGETTSLLQIGEFEQPIRMFLLGEAPFPAETTVIVIVQCNATARDGISIPPGVSKSGFLDFGFLARGVYFRTVMGPNVPSELRNACCTSARKSIFYGDGERELLESLAPLAPMA